MCDVIEFPKKVLLNTTIQLGGTWQHHCEGRGGKLTTWQNDIVVCPCCLKDQNLNDTTRPGRWK